MSHELSLQDFIQIEPRGNTPPLQGIIAYLGKVSFSDSNDWVGVILIGEAAGRGKNDGSVKGKTYFTCEPNHGVFVKRAAVTKLQLSRLEQLRLKRQMRTGGGGGTGNLTAAAATAAGGATVRRSPASAGPSHRRPPSTVISPSNSNMDDDDVSSVTSMGSMRSTITASTNRSRLDEIRARRLNLTSQRSARSNLLSPPTKSMGGRMTAAAMNTPTPQKAQKTLPSNNSGISLASSKTPISTRKHTTPVTTPQTKSSSTPKQPHMTPTATSKARSEKEMAHLQAKISILEQKLQSTTDLNDSLQNLLTKAEKDVHEANLTKVQSLSEVDRIQQELNVIQRREVEQVSKLTEELESVKLSTSTSTGVVLSAGANAASETQMTQQQKNVEDEMNRVKEELTRLEMEKEAWEETKVSLLTDKKDLEERLAQSNGVKESLDLELERERESRDDFVSSLKDELEEAHAKAKGLEKELIQKTSQAAMRDENHAVQYKERAKLQAEVAAAQRRIKEMETERIESETNLEDLVLDKDQLQERLEIMEEQIEEFKIDAESAQIEMEEMKLELEDSRERAERAEASEVMKSAGGSTISEGEARFNDGASADADDVAQALSIQNARLREAIVRLREQTSVEKMELSRQLRTAEKNSVEASTLKEKVDTLETRESKMQSEIRGLQEMVDQGSAFEEMVEDLSDRVLAVEDNNIALQGTIRDLEEAGELNAEMDEAQADEIKYLMRDLQSRDTIILNFEEAIKMQRRRELDFHRTVGNYRSSIEKLSQEKNALMALQEGGEGMKSDAIAASKKALAQAAQMVSDTAEARKREATASFNLIDAQVKSHLSDRLEAFLPQSVASVEIASVKGELLLSKIAMKSSLSLSSVGGIFEKAIKRAQTIMNDVGSHVLSPSTSDSITLTDVQTHQIETMVHQAKFTQIAINISSECIKLLCTGQWPGLLTSTSSMELANTIVHSIPPLDSAISDQLLTLKEEGGLSPHRSNLNLLTQAFESTSLDTNDIVDSDGEPIIPHGWNPPCWEALNLISSSKFYCLGATSLIASVVGSESSYSADLLQTEKCCSAVSTLLTKLNSILSESSNVQKSLAGLDVMEPTVDENITKHAREWKTASEELFQLIEATIKGPLVYLGKVQECETLADTTIHCISRLQSFLRSMSGTINEDLCIHALSPETNDPWGGIIELSKSISGIGTNDLNYMRRGNSLEEQLSVAIENDAKLSIANTKIKSLEKSLATRSKAISIQNGRLNELESLLSKSSALPTDLPSKSVASSEEVHDLKEEIRVLSEAMEVLQSQVDEYEKEIKSLKEPQRYKGHAKRGNMTRKNASLETSFSLAKLGLGSPQKAVSQTTGSKDLQFEAAILRPTIRSSKLDASYWRGKFMSESMLQLPPLSTRKNTCENHSDLLTCHQKLLLAKTEVCNVKAEISMIDLRKMNKTSAQEAHDKAENAVSAVVNRVKEEYEVSRHLLFKNSDLSMRSKPYFADYQEGILGKICFPSAKRKVFQVHMMGYQSKIFSPALAC